MQTINEQKGGGLKILPHDTRDFQLAGVFDQVDVATIPQEDFVVAHPLKVKDQGDTDFCSAYAVSEVTEDQEMVEMLPEYQFYKTKMLSGDPEQWGADLRMACKVLVKFGSLPAERYPYLRGIPRLAVLDPTTWPTECDTIAQNYRKDAFLSVDGRYDIFDNIRTAMWQHRDEKRSIVVGCLWKSQWIGCEGGIIPKDPFTGGFGHAFKIFGQKIIEGEPHLIAQLSNGSQIGDGGIYYFPREVVNREFEGYGQFMFKDLDAETIEYLKNKDKKLSFFETIINALKSLLNI